MHNSETQPSPHLRPREASKYLGVGLSTLWDYANSGKITAITRIIYMWDKLHFFVATCLNP